MKEFDLRERAHFNLNGVYHNAPTAYLASRRDVLASAGGAALLAASPAWAKSAVPTRPIHAPRPSDVCFSVRYARPDALDVARAFGATRLDWCYSEDKTFFRAARAAGMKVLGGALNTILPDTVGGKTRLQGRILDANGRPLTAPWMQWPGIYWGCVNSPAYRTIWLAHARAALAAGVDYFTVDDPTMNVAAAQWGGCFCQYCRTGADTERLDLTKDMAAFQKISVTRFHSEMRAAVDRIAGRHVTFALNNYRGRTFWPYDLFDFGIAEIDPPNCAPDNIAKMLRVAEMAGRPQLLTLRSGDIALNRRMIAWCYANGGQLVVPWDVYLSSTSTGANRLYGQPADFAPIYLFARRLSALLDEAIVSVDLPPGAWSVDGPGWNGAFRTSPSRRRAALHLVPWRDEITSRITISPSALLPGVRRARLLGPGGFVQNIGGKLGPGTVIAAPASPWLVVELEA
jgi:hypothetical protein